MPSENTSVRGSGVEWLGRSSRRLNDSVPRDQTSIRHRQEQKLTVRRADPVIPPGQAPIRLNLLPQPGREYSRIETDGVPNLEGRDAPISGKLVNLTLTDIQQRGYIGHGESCRPFFERVGEIHMSRQSPRLKTAISIALYALNASHSNCSLALRVIRYVREIGTGCRDF